MIQVIRKTVFWTALVFIGLTIFALTVGLILPFEFADYKIMHKFYETITQGLPIAILLTLFGTLKCEKTKARNWTFLGVTVLSSIISFFIMVSLFFTIGFGAWTTLTTIYRHKTEDKVIKEQILDIGALGYGGRRTVEIKPVLKYWILPTKIDTTTINKNEWIFVNEQGEIKFP
jgi:hypothetical protein